MGLPQAAAPRLDDADTVHRVLRNKKQQEELHEAFMLRADEKDSGLSVFFNCTIDEARKQPCFLKTYGAASLLVGGIRKLALEVIANEPHHANIKGVPYKEDDPEGAERIASQLERLAKHVLREKWKQPKQV